jgi:phage terminase small subunit
MEITRAAFVEAYFSNGFNASAAATEIGIAGTPNVAGYRMLSEPEVKRAIGERARRLSELSEMTSVNWARELSCIAFSRIGDVYDPDTGVLLPPHLLPPHVQSAVSSFDGERYRFHDKNAALTTIGKHLGLFERDNAQLRPDIKVRIELVG